LKVIHLLGVICLPVICELDLRVSYAREPSPCRQKPSSHHSRRRLSA